MKSLNNTKSLWSNLSVKELSNTNFVAACCANVKIDAQAKK
ncbi:hypothetical protein [Tumebacillus amylolyticus]|nr:hypothetical protein [Tumebacillus amylolyticus]